MIKVYLREVTRGTVCLFGCFLILLGIDMWFEYGHNHLSETFKTIINAISIGLVIVACIIHTYSEPFRRWMGKSIISDEDISMKYEKINEENQ